MTLSHRRSVFVMMLGLLGAAAVLLLWQGMASEADGATAKKGRFSVVKKRGDAFRNYDFTEKTVSSRKVDWPVGLLFWDNAEIDKVKDDLAQHDNIHGYPSDGKEMFARLKNNGGAYEWDSDEGKKTATCSGLFWPDDAYHYRIYATSEHDRMFNRVWGYYTFATTHIDHKECEKGAWAGMSEDAEGHLANWAKNVYGASRVKDDHRNFGNDESPRRQGSHRWQNDGQATYIKVP